MLFLIGINVYLRAIEEHYSLRREMPNESYQISFEYNSIGVKCMVYREDAVSKTHDRGLTDMRKERKIVWVYPSDNSNRCPVRLTQKYLSLCPDYMKKPNFYLQSRQKFTPSVWYAGQVAGLSLRIFRHSYCGRVVQKSHSSTPKFTRPHLEHMKYAQASEAKPQYGQGPGPTLGPWKPLGLRCP